MKIQTPVSVIMPVYNSESTLLEALESLRKQEYPIKEVIILDNCSTDASIAMAEGYKKKKKKWELVLVKRDKKNSVASSLNIGANMAKSPYIVLMHSDSVLPTSKELTNLVEPFLDDPNVIATYSSVLHPEYVWLQYNFWEKCLFARVVDTEIPALLGKFDCIRKDIFIKLGGYDEKNFVEGADASDANMHFRLKKEGRVVPTSAKVVHLHYMKGDFTLKDWIDRRKLLARAYGRLLRTNWKNLMSQGLIFLVKPVIAVLVFIPYFHFLGILGVLLTGFFSTKKMFLSQSTLLDPRIILLPFINVFLVYYESYWMIRSFLMRKKRV